MHPKSKSLKPFLLKLIWVYVILLVFLSIVNNPTYGKSKHIALQHLTKVNLHHLLCCKRIRNKSDFYFSDLREKQKNSSQILK